MLAQYSILATVCYLTFLIYVSATSNPHSLSDEFINLINSEQDLWVAGRNFPESTPLSYIRRLMGAKQPSQPLQKLKHDPEIIEGLPKNFDAREQWPYCPTIREIRDQGPCGSCWAVSTAAAISDRICIASLSTKIVRISAQDALTCSMTDGCKGGRPDALWKYWVESGLVSGGAYNSSMGCQPYGIPACGFNLHEDCPRRNPYYKTPECSNKCREGYDKTFESDKHYGEVSYGIEGEHNMRAEIYSKGPISGFMTVYEDLIHYQSGVYKHTRGKIVGYHAIKIMGWGVQNGHKYWLVANSWSEAWGDKGTFKIIRGADKEGLASFGLAGDPSL